MRLRDLTIAPPTPKLAPGYADSYKTLDLPLISIPTQVLRHQDSPTDYFGVSKPAAVGEERFHSLTDLKWGEFEAGEKSSNSTLGLTEASPAPPRRPSEFAPPASSFIPAWIFD
jgi:hypothetical protein